MGYRHARAVVALIQGAGHDFQPLAQAFTLIDETPAYCSAYLLLAYRSEDERRGA